MGDTTLDWILILTAIHISNPQDIPATVSMRFADKVSCQMALNTIKYELKFKSFKIIGKCEKIE